MPQFTQLNLQGRSQQTSSREASGETPHHSNPKYKFVAFAGSLAAAALLGVFLLQTSGCSRESENRTAIASPIQPPLPTVAPATPALAAGEPVAQKTTPKKGRQHPYSASTYNNTEYGLSFRYPKSYQLIQPEDAGIDWTQVGPAEMNFTQPGGVPLAAVELPQKSYPGSDFSSAFFSVSVNPKVAAADCGQFAVPRTDASKATKHGGSSVSTEPARVKLGTSEFTEVKNSGGEPPRSSDARYYHVFQGNACYEFAMGLETTSSKKTDNPVNRNEVFRKLNWMLSTVKIETPASSTKTVPEVAKDSVTAPAAESKN